MHAIVCREVITFLYMLYMNVKQQIIIIKLNYKYIRQINDTTINNLKDSIIKHNWDYMYTDNTIDYILNKFNVDLIRLYNDKCPIIQIKDNTKIKKPWIYSIEYSLIKCINKKNKLYRNILKNKNKKL